MLAWSRREAAGARTGELAARPTIERGGRLTHVGYALRWLQSPTATMKGGQTSVKPYVYGIVYDILWQTPFRTDIGPLTDTDGPSLIDPPSRSFGKLLTCGRGAIVDRSSPELGTRGATRKE